jgi:hypothetical protein
MLSHYFDARYAVYLLIATAWTTAFSMTNRQPLRGSRNLGILACYVVFVIMLFRLPFVTAVATWCLFGVAGGLLYIAHELFLGWRTKDSAEKPAVSLATLIHGPLAWPIMIPEAIENTLAELGILKTPPLQPPDSAIENPSPALPPLGDANPQSSAPEE